MTWHFANPALLAGLAGIAIPLLVHFLSRRKAPVVDWGAMQFLEVGRRAHRRFQLTELLLMLARMALLSVVALAVTKPFWTEDRAAAAANAGNVPAQSRTAPRDVVLILDGSDSMQRKAGGTTPHARAVTWARDFARRLGSGSSVALLLAKDQVKPVIAPASFDLAKVDHALAGLLPSRGSSDFPSAFSEALRLLDKGQNTEQDIIVLSDGQKLPWRLNEPRRWELIRDLYHDQARRLAVTPRLWCLDFTAGTTPEGADGSVEPLDLARGLVPPGGAIRIQTNILNAGPAPLTRTVELLVDGKPVSGSARAVGPIPPGGKAPVTFQTSIDDPGSHLLTVRLAASLDDPMTGNDESARPVEVTRALPVCLVDGERGLEPLSSETDFLRAALAPTGDDTPQVQASVVTAAEFGPDACKNKKVIVLANVEMFTASQAATIAEFLSNGGGVLVAPGDRVESRAYNDMCFQNGSGWLPARLVETRGDARRKEIVAHPAPPSFVGTVLAPFAQGDAPALGEADLFSYHVLAPATRSPAAVVAARLDTGDPWIIERPYRRGRVILLAGPIDAEGGTLPVNPDFVPWAHELVFHLADPASRTHVFRPGETVSVDLDSTPPPAVTALDVVTPSGRTIKAGVHRAADGHVEASFQGADEPGIYRVALAEPAGAFAFVNVIGDSRETDAEPLSANDRKTLSEGWPLAFESSPESLPSRLLASGSGTRHPVWRGLVLAALAGLCLEVWLTRRLVMTRGMADVAADH